jgi:hypothetical protein
MKIHVNKNPKKKKGYPLDISVDIPGYPKDIQKSKSRFFFLKIRKSATRVGDDSTTAPKLPTAAAFCSASRNEQTMVASAHSVSTFRDTLIYFSFLVRTSLPIFSSHSYI